MHTRYTQGSRSRSGRIAAVAALMLALSAGCATSRLLQRATDASVRGDWDAAAELYTTALQNNPDRVEYRMALERAQLAAAQLHSDRAREYERRDQLDLALHEYRKVVDYHAANSEARSRIAALEQLIRQRSEAARPRPAIDAMREQARKAPAEPTLNPKSQDGIDFTMKGQLRDILIGMGTLSGVTVNFDRDFQDKLYSVELKNIPFEQALQQVMAANSLFYKVIGERSIIVVQDVLTKRQAYEEQALQTFYLSHADANELMTLLNTVIRVNQSIQPVLAAGQKSNTIVARASVPMLQIIGRLIEANDKPRAEVVVDVEILEVNRNRAKQYGLDLGSYAIGLNFSPGSPATGALPSTTTGTTGSTSAAITGPTVFNLATIAQGVAGRDIYATLPGATVKFLESDVNTKVIAKTQLRGQEGEALSLNLGEELPVPATTFTPIVSGGTAMNPMTSFTYRPVGVNVEIKPRVTFEDDVVMELKLEVSAQGSDKNIAGQNLPSFSSRKVGSKLRLRDGESNLLAGLLKEDERKSLRGLPGLLNLPILRQLFSSNDTAVQQTDIVMLLTPHIIRTHELTAQDVTPIYIGTQQNLGLTDAPPTFGGPPQTEVPPAAAPAKPAGALAPGTPVPAPPGTSVTPVIPPGSSPVPGTVAIQPKPPVQALPAPATAPAAPAAAQPATAAQGAVQGGAPTPTLGATVAVGAPESPLLVAGGPYTIPVTVAGASRLSTITVSLSYNPRVLRARLASEGDFMRKGGVKVTFVYKKDDVSGRIDITISRANDAAGASGDGVVAGVIFDAIGSGQSALAVSGAATGPDGAAVPLQFVPGAVIVR